MSDNKNRGLGKGLDALFGATETYDPVLSTDDVPKKVTVKKDVTKISMHLIDRNLNQPRQTFREEKLNDLADSIKIHGVLQPVLVTAQDGRYMLVAGERRWRASKLAGLKEIPAIIKELSEEEISEIALIENLQRDDLNPIEEAQGIKNLMAQFKLTQEQVSKRLSKSRPAIANTLRLLNLPEYITKHIIDGTLSSGHGRCLAGISNEKLQKKLCEMTVSQNLNVRQLESLVKSAGDKPSEDETNTKQKTDDAYPEFKEFQDTLQKTFGMKVDIKGSLEKGKITINYSNRDELESFYDMAKKLK